MIFNSGGTGKLMHARVCNRVKRVKALLATNCLNYTQIGKRVGLTRERIRQIADMFGYEADSRHGICKMEHPKPVKIRPLLAKLIQELDKRGIAYSIEGRFLRINGKSCVPISMCSHPAVGKHSISAERRSHYVNLRRPQAHADFTIGRADKEGGIWFIVPWDTLPDVQTTFSLHPKPGMGATTLRHDYLFYKDRWDLLM